eukprot:scaffold235083_cov50-Attheya_sp.AAC.1
MVIAEAIAEPWSTIHDSYLAGFAPCTSCAIQPCLTQHGYDLKCVGAHLLRASGAMALKLNGYTVEDIMKIGRWTSTTFLTYIHSQIAALNNGIAANMPRQTSFHNVGG